MHFPTTRWSLIFNGKQRVLRQQAKEPLGELCQMYWRPVFGFICRHGYSVPEAQDLTQDFFVQILEGNLLSSADPLRGRFRSLLLKSLKNFLIDATIRNGRLKRGGGVEFIPGEIWEQNPADWLEMNQSPPAEAAFDVRWAATIAEYALRRLREECESKDHRQFFEVLNPYLDADRTEISYQSISTQLGISTKSVKHLLHEFRKRFRTLLREEVAKTVQDPADLEDEIRYLCAVLSSVTA
jgi:RNA polymerase sigma-70 factor (ECF subfamily)